MGETNGNHMDLLIFTRERSKEIDRDFDHVTIQIPGGVMAAMANVASGQGINMAVVTMAPNPVGLRGAGPAFLAAQIGNQGNDRFCGRCLGGTDNTVCADPTNPTGVAGALAVLSICSKSTVHSYSLR